MTEVTITKPETEVTAPKPVRKGRPPGAKNTPKAKDPGVEESERKARHFKSKAAWQRRLLDMPPEELLALREALMGDEPAVCNSPAFGSQMPGISHGFVGICHTTTPIPGNTPGNNPLNQTTGVDKCAPLT